MGIEQENLDDVTSRSIYEVCAGILDHQDFIKHILKSLDVFNEKINQLYTVHKEPVLNEYYKIQKIRILNSLKRLKEALELEIYAFSTINKIEIMLIELTPRQREMFYLIGFKGYSKAQVAKKLKRTAQTIDNTLNNILDLFFMGYKEKNSIAKKTLFKNAYRLDEKQKAVKVIKELCKHTPPRADVIVKELLNRYVTLDNNKYLKQFYIDNLLKFHNKDTEFLKRIKLANALLLSF